MDEGQPVREAIPAPGWISRMVRAEPRAPLMGPYMVYLLLMMVVGALPAGTALHHLGIILHIGGAAWAAWLLRHHWPPLGRPHLLAAIPVGLFTAWLWVAGQHWLDGIGVAGHTLGERLSVGTDFPFVRLVADGGVDVPRQFETSAGFWTHVVLKIARAVTVVPVVEELFWRGFILRAFVNWHRFEAVPAGTFTWFAFLGSSVLSVLQHPANWGVSIPCWMLFNALFYWTRSLRCLMITHAVTNLALYGYVVWTHLQGGGDWQFW